jgi:N-methylhydantoinase A
MRGLHVGVDIGGTFTDCVVITEKGAIVTTKSPSTPPHFADGMMAALEQAGKELGLTFSEFCDKIAVLTHGTTVGTNALIQRRGAKVGLITTRGHEDAIHIMRGSRGVTSRNLNQVVHFPESQKPVPIVPKKWVRGVSERVDCMGQTIVPISKTDVDQAITELLEQGVEAIAVCLLWSFKSPAHEQYIKQQILKRAPNVFVSCSVDLAPKWGEYERMTATALNAYIGPVTSDYLKKLDRRLKSAGYKKPLQITQCGGGSISVERAIEAPLLTLDSGPVSGVTGSQFLGRILKIENMITTDMGGTSFDVGIIHRGQPSFSFMANVAQYEYFIPKVDIQAIGSGGGSLAVVDRTTKTLRVGPESAGANPGPACYGKGNDTPTVTDADLVLGYLDPNNFLGGKIVLNREKSVAAVQRVADQLGLGLYETAAGIAKIAEFKMADIIRKTTVEKGLDPRDFSLFAFGGAGPVHAGIFARELGAQKVLVPLNRVASTWCAFGAATANLLHIHERVEIIPSPFQLAAINSILGDLYKTAGQQMGSDGIPTSGRTFQFSVDMRHRGQINEVEVPLTSTPIKGGLRLNDQDLNALIERFYLRYEAIYGKGSSYRDSRLEMVTFRLRAMGAARTVTLPKAKRSARVIKASAKTGKRRVYWTDLGRQMMTQIYNGELLDCGNTVTGPAIVETSHTTIVVHPQQKLLVDAYGNFELKLGGHHA